MDYLDFRNHIDSNYNKLEIYCYCFIHKKPVRDSDSTISVETSSCTTTIAVLPGMLATPKHLYKSILNQDTIKSIQKLIFDKKANYEPFPHSLDSRLLFLFRSETNHNDTLVLYPYTGNYNQLCLPGKLLIKYPFNFLDSIKTLLNMPDIDCRAH